MTAVVDAHLHACPRAQVGPGRLNRLNGFGRQAAVVTELEENDLLLAEDLFATVGRLRRRSRRASGPELPESTLSEAQFELVRLVAGRASRSRRWPSSWQWNKAQVSILDTPLAAQGV